MRARAFRTRLILSALALALGACGDSGGTAPDSGSGGDAPAGTGDVACGLVPYAVQELPARRCTYPVPDPPGAGYSRRSIRVVVDDLLIIPRDPTRADGWDYIDPADTTIEIFGPACDEIVAGRYQAVQIVYACAPS